MKESKLSESQYSILQLSTSHTPRHQHMQQILIITHHNPWPPTSGFHQRLVKLIKHLSNQGHQLKVVTVPVPPWEELSPRLEGTKIDENVTHYRIRFRKSVLQRLFRSIRKRYYRLPQIVRQMMKYCGFHFPPNQQTKKTLGSRTGQRYYKKNLEFFNYEFEQIGFDTIIVEHIQMNPVIAELCTEGKTTIIDTHDIMHQRAIHHKEHNAEISHYHQWTREEESDVLSGYDVVIAIQSEEAAQLELMAPESKVIITGVDYEITPINESYNHVVFVAGLGSANANGICWFIEHVWSSVLKSVPDAILQISGKICESKQVKHACRSEPRSIQLVGYVDKIASVYQGQVVIAPLTFGSGLKIKVVEALCHGKPTVTTSFGAQGLSDGVNKAFIVRDDPAEFAEAVVDLLTDQNKRKEYSLNAVDYANNRFSEKSVYAELDQFLNKDV